MPTYPGKLFYQRKDLCHLKDCILSLIIPKTSVGRLAMGPDCQQHSPLLANLNGSHGGGFRHQASVCSLGVSVLTQPRRAVLPAALLVGNNVKPYISLKADIGLF